MKNVILFIDNLGSGGAQRQIVNLAILLKQKQYNVQLVVYLDIPFYQPILERHSIPIDIIKCKGILERIRKVRRYLRKSDADIVISFLETPGFLACLSKIGGAKWKLITNELSAKKSTFFSLKNKIYNWFERFSDAKVCNSENARGMWEAYYPQYKPKLHTIYNPVIIPCDLQKSTKKMEDKCCVVVAASYQALKNPLAVIEAVNLLDENEKQQLVLEWYGRAEVTAGNTVIYDEAVSRVQEYGLQDIIHLNGETDNIYEHMMSSDIVGLFSTVEGLPNAICEGMMLGKPILMSTVSDYTILTDNNGILCNAHSIESIRDALIQVVNLSDEQLELMGKKSKEKAELLFSGEDVIQQWIQLINQLTK